MQTLASWLGALGLERYAPIFERDGIDLRSLPLLGEDDLAELGVLLGHRRLLLKAMATLPTLSDLAAVCALERGAERRQLTVVFCDLVGSTALARRLDVEAFRSLLQTYQDVVRQVVARYGGHVAQYLGDGLVIYFGYPSANEDDAERAVRAALDIITAISGASQDEPLQVRIGVATGAVVVGGRVVGDASVPEFAVGETPNIAARLQALAGPDHVVVAPSTYRMLGNTFELEDLGDHTLKGIEGTVRVRRVCALTPSESRFEATRAGHLTPFVGREHEIASLLAYWRRAEGGQGRVVLIRGESGIGKSRIARLLRDRLKGTPHTLRHLQCSPYHSGSAFFPFIEQLGRAAQFKRDDSPQGRLDKLEAILCVEPDELTTVGPFLAALFSLPIERYPPRMLSPYKHRELTIAALVDQLVRPAERRPVLMICEDAHWADASTMEALALVVERINRAAVLVVITCRPEFAPSWIEHANVSTLELGRLSSEQSVAMIDRLIGEGSFPVDVVSQIRDRADGVPLFVEELTTSLLETSRLDERGSKWVLRDSLVQPAIPSTLQDSLTGRLDRLGAAKELAQIGACIGREFGHELLAIVASLDVAALEERLDELVLSGLVFRHSFGGETTYSFKHALVRDVAYDGLLKSQRQQVHLRIARALTGHFPDVARGQPELLALHLTRADLIDEAVPQWRAAARTAMANNRHREALGHVDAGLALLDRARTDQRANFEVGLLIAGTAVHWALEGYACEAAAALSARAEALLSSVMDERLLILALASVHLYAYVHSDMPKALDTAERLISLAHSTSDTYSKVAALSAVGPILWQEGQFERCRQLLEIVVGSEELDRRSSFGRIGDSKVNAYLWLSWVHTWTGHLDQARQCARMAIERATVIAQPFALSMALGMAARPFAEAGDCEEALVLSRRSIELCDAQHLPFWKGWAMVSEGVALVMLGQYDRAETRLAQGAAHVAAAGGRNDLGRIGAWRAIALARLRRFNSARHECETARAECLATEQTAALIEIGYASGLTEMLDPDADVSVAEALLRFAVDSARGAGMRLVQLRAAKALAALWQQQGKEREALDILAPIADAFPEGIDCLDLREARRLLKALSRAG